jgi:hypothetical protein
MSREHITEPRIRRLTTASPERPAPRFAVSPPYLNGTAARSCDDESRESLASIAVRQYRSVIDAPILHRLKSDHTSGDGGGNTCFASFQRNSRPPPNHTGSIVRSSLRQPSRRPPGNTRPGCGSAAPSRTSHGAARGSRLARQSTTPCCSSESSGGSRITAARYLRIHRGARRLRPAREAVALGTFRRAAPGRRPISDWERGLAFAGAQDACLLMIRNQRRLAI